MWKTDTPACRFEPPLLPMSEGYQTEGKDAAFSGLDEFLCEYVDGTMDPKVQEAFEEYLCANPDLAEHVQCLCQTRRLLCDYGHSCQGAPRGFQDRLRRRLSREIMQGQLPKWPDFTPRLGTFAAWTSAMLLMVILGMLAGATVLSEEPASLAKETPPAVEMPPPAPPPQDRFAGPPLWSAQQQTWLSLSGPYTALPTITRRNALLLRPYAPVGDTAQTALRRLGTTP